MQSETQFLRKKQRVLPAFKFFARYKITLVIGNIILLTRTYLTVPRLYTKSI
jgi:hypothetical protein